MPGDVRVIVFVLVRRLFLESDDRTMNKQPDKMKQTARLMGALVRMKPKPHEEMRLNPKAKKPKSPVRKRASAKLKTS